MTRYLFLTNDSFVVEGIGDSFESQKINAMKNIRKAEKKSSWKIGAPRKIVAWDAFDKDGLSYNNWKRLK